jgi:site-specific DNA-methyltransferase (adenine-specific)
MNNMPPNFVDLVITSPPYNLSKKRKGGPSDTGKYDTYKDNMLENDYIDWTINIFNGYDKVVKENRAVLYNFSYSIENPSLPYKIAAKIVENTNWEIVDTILWKKNTSMPHPASYNRLNRIFEFVWVFARKSEVKTFKMFKEVVKISKSGQKYYQIVDNYLEAKNNDGSNDLNKATFSTDLVTKLLSVYGTEGDLVYDSFMGIGTTALGAIEKNCNFIGSEISDKQCDLSTKKIKAKIKSKIVTI